MKDKKEIIIPDINYQVEVKKCKTMEDVVGKSGLMQNLFKDVIQQLLEAEINEHIGKERVCERSNEQSLFLKHLKPWQSFYQENFLLLR